jgi:hypothetical protein
MMIASHGRIEIGENVRPEGKNDIGGSMALEDKPFYR